MKRSATICSLLFLLVMGCLVYVNTLNVPFHFDDENNIQHPALRIESLDSEQVVQAFTDGTLASRPVSNFSFALNYFIGEYRV